MKRIIYNSIFFFTGLILSFNVSAQNKYTAPALSDPGSWSMILLPDPQSYVKFSRNQPLFELMTAWIEGQISPLNIQMVLCTGDLVEQNDLLNPDGINGDQPSKLQWEYVSKAFGRLDGKAAYFNATGNHDFGIVSAENRRTHYDEYFPIDKNHITAKMLREVGTDQWGVPSLTNACYEFVSPYGRDMLVLVLEFAPRDAAIEWAKRTISKEKYKDHYVILLTHSYMNAQNERIKTEGYAVKDANYGEALWEKLIYPSSNIRMVLAGHIGVPDDPQGHIAFRTDMNSAGKKVQQMVFNAQALGGGWHGNGGDGWLRILEFLPDGKTVSVKTFSPLFAISPSTQHMAWRTEEYDQFFFEME